MINIKNISNKINRISYISRSKKISLALKKILKTQIIGIVDIGAGHRYLPVLLNFDGISKIAMVDPNKSLNWSAKNFKKIIKYPENIYQYNFGISDKTEKKKYYVAKTLTGSTFIDVYKIAKKGKKKLSNEYFGEENSKIQQVFSFKDFKKKFFKFNVDIVKIDVEGLEEKIVSSVIKNSNPSLIEVETNLNSEIYPNSFNKINHLLIKKNYKLVTGFSIFKRTKNKKMQNSQFELGNYDNPILRSSLEQFECIYIKDKKKYDLKDIVIFIGYGLLHEVKKIIHQSKIKFSKLTESQVNKIIKDFF